MSLPRSWRKRRKLLSINIPSLTGLVVRRRILFKKQEVTILFSRRSQRLHGENTNQAQWPTK